MSRCRGGGDELSGRHRPIRPPRHSPGSSCPHMNDQSPKEQVEILVPVRTLLKLGLFGGFVVLVVVALDVLLSIFVAAVLAVGLDPVVGALVRRGWGRGRAALAVFAGLFVAVALIVLITVGPLWDQVREFVAEIPAYWQGIEHGRVPDLRLHRHPGERARRARGPREGPARGGLHAARDRGRDLRKPAVARDADVPLAVPAHRAAHDHRVAVRFRAPRGSGIAGTRCWRIRSGRSPPR